MDSTAAVDTLQAAHSEALMNAITRTEPTDVTLTLDTAEALMRYIESLRMRNMQLGKLYADSSNAIARVSFFAGELSQSSYAAIGEGIMDRITKSD